MRGINKIIEQFNYKSKNINKLATQARHTPGKFSFEGKQIVFPDSSSFVFTYREIFEKQIYSFKSQNSTPFIIDCGANIGLSVIYFKRLYPESKIVAFEPEKNIYQYLNMNLLEYSINDIEINNKALWKEDGEIMFFNEKSDASRIISDSTTIEDSFYLVPCVRLSHYINQKIDFLKIDIEGAELEVLREIQSKLNLVDRIFIEYHSFENRNQELDELLSILSNNGFRYFINSSVNTAETPFVKVEKWFGFDLFLNIFAYRL